MKSKCPKCGSEVEPEALARAAPRCDFYSIWRLSTPIDASTPLACQKDAERQIEAMRPPPLHHQQGPGEGPCRCAWRLERVSRMVPVHGA
ncbi:MAG TPA: hypothetical protein VM537_20945 [Anaerolineae bacterium]|nr:hypothetical protein [Anaerolineae bacterium]